MREVDTADVYIGDDLAARLVRQRGDKVSFDYLEDGPLGRRVRDRSASWSLLRSGEYPVVTTGGSVPAFFAGLLPEGVRLGVVTRSTKTSTDDHLTLLLAVALTRSETSGYFLLGHNLSGRHRCSTLDATPTSKQSLPN